jgi:hypothetical protein
MKLVVLNVANPFAPVNPQVPAGPEQLLSHLDAALTISGHESFVMACEGSVTEGILLATPRPLNFSGTSERHRIHEQYRFILQSFLEKWPIDLIHMHGADFYEYLPSNEIPVLATLHQPLKEYPKSIFHLDRPRTFLQCTNADQRAACPPCPYLLPQIEDASSFDFSEDSLGGRFLDAVAIDKYFAIYERLVGEARALEAHMESPAEPHLEIVDAHA